MAEGGEDDMTLEDIFGDFVSDEEAKDPKAAAKRPAEAAAPADGAVAAKRPRRGAAAGDPSRFFELEAEEAGEGSGDEEDAADLEDLIDDSGEPSKAKKFKLQAELQRAANAELEEVAADMAARGPETGARRVFGGSFLDRMQERYERMEQAGQAQVEHKPMRPIDFGRLPKEATTTHIVPAPTDPKLWRCKSFADERQLCISLMHKAADYMAKGRPVPISSVFYSQHQRGFIYIEAMREAEVRDFCKGIRGISPWLIIVVPMAQMPQVFDSAVTDADFQTTLKVGDFVRYRRAPYNGDLAQVEEINDEEYVVRLKPRIQYKLELAAKADDKESRASRKRPAARWFNKHDLEAAGVLPSVVGRATAKGTLYFYGIGDDVYRDGFVYKTTKASGLDHGSQVRPQEHELQDWRAAPAVSELTRPPQDLKGEVEEKKLMPPPSFIPVKAAAPTELVEGDVVIVNTGELKNLRGRVVKAIFQAKTVTVRPLDLGVAQDLELAVATLCKYFEVGDYVKATGGSRTGEVGYIMKLIFPNGVEWHKDSRAIVLNAGFSVEFEARLDQLRLTAERAEAVLKRDEFELGQLVALPGRSESRGVIIRLEDAGEGSAEVLLPNNERQHFGLSELASLPQSEARGGMLFGLDRLGQKITAGCIVKAPRGQQVAAPVRAEIRYIAGDTLFLEAAESLAGERKYIACNSRRTELIYDGREVMNMGKGRGRGERRRGRGQGHVIKEETNRVDDDEKPENPQEDNDNDEPKPGKMSYGITMASQAEFLSREFKQKVLGLSEEGASTKLESGHPLRIVAGAYKGLRGEVRADLGDKVRLLLLCKAKLVTVPTSAVMPDDYVNNPARLRRKPRNLPTGMPAPAPGTPTAGWTTQFSPAAVPPSPAAALPDGAADAAAAADEAPLAAPAPKVDPPLDEDNSWDPTYLLAIKEDKKVNDSQSHKDEAGSQRGDGPLLPVHGDSQDGEHGQATSSTAPAPASPAPSAASSRRRRQSKLPGSEDAAASSWEDKGDSSWKGSWSSSWQKPDWKSDAQGDWKSGAQDSWKSGAQDSGNSEKEEAWKKWAEPEAAAVDVEAPAAADAAAAAAAAARALDAEQLAASPVTVGAITPGWTPMAGGSVTPLQGEAETPAALDTPVSMGAATPALLADGEASAAAAMGAETPFASHTGAAVKAGDATPMKLDD